MADENQQNKNFWSITSEIWDRLTTLLINPYVLIFGIAGFFVWIMWTALLSPDQRFLLSLQNVEVARGLITFLIALGTIAIAIILALYPITTTAQDSEKRFGQAKEILTLLIGVLGTIVGFYFGQSFGISQEGQLLKESKKIIENTQQALQVQPFFISNEKPKKGEAISLASWVAGGKPPYTYTISFEPASAVSQISNKQSMDGYIKEMLLLQDFPDKSKEFTFKLAVKDSAGKSSIYEDKAKKIVAAE